MTRQEGGCKGAGEGESDDEARGRKLNQLMNGEICLKLMQVGKGEEVEERNEMVRFPGKRVPRQSKTCTS